MTIQEQIKELSKVVTLLVKSRNSRLANGKHTAVELDYQIDACKAAIKSLETINKMKEDVKRCLETLDNFDFGLIQ